MINTNEIIKKLRQDYKLTQEQFGRAVGCEGTSISRYENGSRVPDIETFIRILNTFGYDLELTLKERVGHKKDINFYNEKTYTDILNMDIKDLVDYIFVTQDDFVIANICNISIGTLEYIPLSNIKKLIEDKIKDIDRLAVYFMINQFWLKVETQMAHFINHIKYHLTNLSNLDKELVDKIEYIFLSTDFYSEGHHSCLGYHYFTEIKALNKDEKDLNISKKDIDGEQVPLDDSIDFELGEYLYNRDALIKLNY